MSALSVLYLVLALPLAFILHDLEEIAVQHKWMTGHRASLLHRFPRMQPLIDHLYLMNTRAFAIAAAEELVILAGITAYVCIQGPYALHIWISLFMAFTLHLLIHLIQAMAVSGYVPGLVTSILLLPYAAYGVWSITLVIPAVMLLLLTAAGLLLVAVNLRFAHWLGLRLTQETGQQ